MAQTKTAAKKTRSTKKTTATAKAKRGKAAVAKAKAPAKSRAKKSSETAAKKTAKKAATKRAKATAGEEAVTIDRRREDRRTKATGEKAAEKRTAKPKLERREKVNRRRQIDPTTCERDYSDAEVEFMNALDDYKRKNGRMFPTCSEVLEVIRDLGYVQLSAGERAARSDSEVTVPAPAEDPQTLEAEQELSEALATSDELRV